MGAGTITAAAIQFSGRQGEPAHNSSTAVGLIRSAAAAGAQIILTPECALSGLVGPDVAQQPAEEIPGPSTQLFEALAQELRVYILLGLPELKAGEIMNAMAVISPSQGLLGVMRKVHINKYETAADGWRNGSEFPVWTVTTDTGQACIGIMICYDREMPESARMLMLQGADIIFNPLACSCPTDDIHRCLLRTRAFENEVYLITANHGAPGQNGHSMAIDFGGRIVCELGDQEGILTHTADLEALNRHRAAGIYGPHHRRPELYGRLCDPSGQTHPPEANLPAESSFGKA